MRIRRVRFRVRVRVRVKLRVKIRVKVRVRVRVRVRVTVVRKWTTPVTHHANKQGSHASLKVLEFFLLNSRP